MKCTEHDREPCPEPRCHVLAVCWASVPEFAGQSYRNTWRRWAWLRDHGYVQERHEATKQIATRLVAWMHWVGERRAGAIRLSGYAVYGPHSRGPLSEQVWRVLGPGFYHPLDAIAPHAMRVKALKSECRHCGWAAREHRDILAAMSSDATIPPVQDRLKELAIITTECNHDEVNWATVAMYLDWLMGRDGAAQGWTWRDVHEWQPETQASVRAKELAQASL